MTHSQKRLITSKRYTSWVLVLFVVSILNMSAQIPAHAAMQLSMQQDLMSMSGEMKDHSNMPAMDHSNMSGMDMQNCECPPSLCDTVEAQQDQISQNELPALPYDAIAFYPISLEVTHDILHQTSGLFYRQLDKQYRKINPSPLSKTSTLLI